MFPGYGIIIGLFILGGLGVAAWGWANIAKTRRQRGWLQVDGVIESTARASEFDDLLPNIVFRYTVGDKTYRRDFDFPSGTNPSPELTANYLKKYPAGGKVPVYYDPAHPETATLDPGPGGDWLIFAIGLVAALLGIVLLFA